MTFCGVMVARLSFPVRLQSYHWHCLLLSCGKEIRINDASNNGNNRLYVLLAYAGILPFAACALLTAAGVPAIEGLAGWAEIAAGYGLAIAAFMAGVHWGTYIYKSQDEPGVPLNLLVTSNVITVAVWLAYALTPVSVSIAVTGVAFMLLLLVDHRLAGAGLITPAYWQLRRNVTLLVVALLVMTAALA